MYQCEAFSIVRLGVTVMLFPIGLSSALVIGLLPVDMSSILREKTPQTQSDNLSEELENSLLSVQNDNSRFLDLSQLPNRNISQSAVSGIDFSGEGRSGHRNGGGSRSDCPSVDSPLTALMPSSNFGKAISTHPQIWFYIPYTPEQAPTGEFILQDRDRNDVYRASITLPNALGLVSITLPDTAPELALNQDYRWYFNLYCDADKASSPIFVQGWVQRVSSTPQLETQLANSPEHRDWAYAENGIWFDAISSLAKKRMANPTDSNLIADWNALLNAEGVNLDLPDSLPFVGPIILTEDLD